MADFPQQNSSKGSKTPNVNDEKVILTLNSENLNAWLGDKDKKKETEQEGGQEIVEEGQDGLKKGEQLNTQIKKRKEYSKYDFIKVRVTLGEHFYVLSRFLVSRMLTLCKV